MRGAGHCWTAVDRTLEFDVASLGVVAAPVSSAEVDDEVWLAPLLGDEAGRLERDCGDPF